MRNDLLRALAGQRVDATPVMGDAEKTTILAATPGGGYGDADRWDDDDEVARKQRKRRIIAIVSVLAVLLLGGAIAAAIALNGDPGPPPAAKVQIPVLAGQTETAARQAIADQGLVVGDVTTEASTTVVEGLVISSSPSSGASVEKGSKVNLVVSGGPDTVAVPNVVGLTEDRARSTLEQAGFTSVSSRQVESLRDEGTVVSVTPGEGKQAAPNTRITLEVSTGTTKLPDVRGQDQATATKTLQDAGFGNTTVEMVDATEPEGTVISTDPGPGTQASASTRITLRVSGGAAEIVVPNVVGQPEAVARQILIGAGLTNITHQDTEPGDVAPGQVAGTEPGTGTRVAPGTEIVLLVVPLTGG
jgi:serine/threonine-protein kinase